MKDLVVYPKHGVGKITAIEKANKGEIDIHYDDNGEVIWDQGNNAQPVADGKCCDKCNMDIVLPHRLADTYLNKGGANG